jgi:hypothetical protein
VALSLEAVVPSAVQDDIAGCCGATVRIGHNVVEFEHPALGAPMSVCTDERALAPIPFPYCSSHRRGNASRAALLDSAGNPLAFRRPFLVWLFGTIVGGVAGGGLT